jgi:hypothetical protein
MVEVVLRETLPVTPRREDVEAGQLKVIPFCSQGGVG